MQRNVGFLAVVFQPCVRCSAFPLAIVNPPNYDLGLDFVLTTKMFLQEERQVVARLCHGHPHNYAIIGRLRYHSDGSLDRGQ